MVAMFFVSYGVLSIPVYWLQELSAYNFQTLTGLSIAFTIVTNVLIALLNIYIPYCMRTAVAASDSPGREGTSPSGSRPIDTSLADSRFLAIDTADPKVSRKRTYGFKMAVKGALANSIGALVMYIIVIIITQTTMDVQYPYVQ